MTTQLVGNNVVTQFVSPADLGESQVTSIAHQAAAFTEIGTLFPCTISLVISINSLKTSCKHCICYQYI